MSLLPDNSPNPEELTENFHDNKTKNNWLFKSIETLNEREKLLLNLGN